MKSPTGYSLLLCCFVLAGLVYALAASAAQTDDTAEATTDAAVAQWEHLALTHDDAKIGGGGDLPRQINRLGNEGWELVTVSTVVNNGTTEKTIFFFKRFK